MTEERLFGWHHAFDHPVTRWITLGVTGFYRPSSKTP